MKHFKQLNINFDTIERFFKIEVGTYEWSNIGPPTKRGPLSAHKRNAISIAFAGGPTVARD